MIGTGNGNGYPGVLLQPKKELNTKDRLDDAAKEAAKPGTPLQQKVAPHSTKEIKMLGRQRNIFEASLWSACYRRVRRRRDRGRRRQGRNSRARLLGALILQRNWRTTTLRLKGRGRRRRWRRQVSRSSWTARFARRDQGSSVRLITSPITKDPTSQDQTHRQVLTSPCLYRYYFRHFHERIGAVIIPSQQDCCIADRKSTDPVILLLQQDYCSHCSKIDRTRHHPVAARLS